MMPKLFLIFNHTLTPEQESDARASLGVDEIEEMPQELHGIWSNIPPDKPAIDSLLKPVKTWLAENAEPDDFVLVQGDFGACYLIVTFAFEKGLIPVYSTTLRQTRETRGPDGSINVSRTFKHLIYRRYGL